jgi:hypothetical protein
MGGGGRSAAPRHSREGRATTASLEFNAVASVARIQSNKAAPLPMLAFGRIGQDGSNVLVREARKVPQDFILAHPTGEGRLGAAHAGGDLNAFLPIHDRFSVGIGPGPRQASVDDGGCRHVSTFGSPSG